MRSFRFSRRRRFVVIALVLGATVLHRSSSASSGGLPTTRWSPFARRSPWSRRGWVISSGFRSSSARLSQVRSRRKPPGAGWSIDRRAVSRALRYALFRFDRHAGRRKNRPDLLARDRCDRHGARPRPLVSWFGLSRFTRHPPGTAVGWASRSCRWASSTSYSPMTAFPPSG